MQAVLCLLEDNRVWRINHLIGHFLTTMRGQAVHENSIRFGAGKQCGVDLIAPENITPLPCFGFLAHAGPYVGVNHVRSSSSFFRIVGDPTAAACLAGPPLGPRQRVHPGFVAGRGCNPNLGAQLCASEHERMRHVVAVADICNLQPVQIAFCLPHGEVVRHGLAGMTVIGQTVDHGDPGVMRHVFHDFVRKGPDHDALHHALQVLGHVIYRFTLAEADL